ncbi:hypothetical protein JCM17960_03630 [Magnetospira thiophila]
MLVQVKNHTDHSNTWWNPVHRSSGSKANAMSMVLSLSGRVRKNMESKAWKTGTPITFVHTNAFGTLS